MAQKIKAKKEVTFLDKIKSIGITLFVIIVLIVFFALIKTCILYA